MRTLPVIVVALATAGPVAAQDVLLRMKPPQGQVTHYLMGVETFMKGGPMAQMMTDTTAPFMRMTGWITNTVTAAAGDEFTLNQVLDSAQIASPAMPQMEQMMGQMTGLMKGTETISRMTSRGRMMAVQVNLPAALKSMMAAQGGREMDMGSGANSGTMSSFVLLPERPVRVGTSWQDSMTVSLDSAGAAGAKATFAATFTLKRMEGRVAVIGVDGTYRMVGGPVPGGATFTLTGETRLDVDAGRATAMTAEMNGSAPTPMGEMPMKVKTTMTQQ